MRHSRHWRAPPCSAPGEVIFAAVVVISVAGSLAAVLMASPRVYYAMAQDGLFFPSFAAVDPPGLPARATAIQATLVVHVRTSGHAAVSGELADRALQPVRGDREGRGNAREAVAGREHLRPLVLPSQGPDRPR